MARNYGYARVSTDDQKTDRQIVELLKFVSKEFILEDKKSGKDFERPQYQLLKNIVNIGDCIYIKSLDRLGRNKQQIKQELEYFKTKGVRIKFIDMPTTMMDYQEGQEWVIDMINNLVLEVLSTMAEQERINIRTRQAEGIAIYKATGKTKEGKKAYGRPKAIMPNDFEHYYNEVKSGNITALEAMTTMGLKRNTFYKFIKEFELAN